MNLPLIGKNAEKDALRFKLIKKARKMPYNAPFDYYVYGFKIDVKSAQLKTKNFAKQYIFSVKRKKHVADFYLCMCYINKKLEQAYLLPAYICSAKDIRIPSDPDNSFEQYRMIY